MVLAEAELQRPADLIACHVRDLLQIVRRIDGTRVDLTDSHRRAGSLRSA